MINNESAMNTMLILSGAIICAIIINEINTIEINNKKFEESKCVEFLNSKNRLDYNFSKRKCNEFLQNDLKWKSKARRFLQN